eukprot:scaffold20534_cov19-Prasinocladus_malaysianus.AAC.1
MSSFLEPAWLDDKNYKNGTKYEHELPGTYASWYRTRTGTTMSTPPFVRNLIRYEYEWYESFPPCRRCKWTAHARHALTSVDAGYCADLRLNNATREEKTDDQICTAHDGATQALEGRHPCGRWCRLEGLAPPYLE